MVKQPDAVQESERVDGETFRHVLGHFATGVTVVTASTREGPVGMVANSFTSVSLEPPLILFCAGNESDTWPDIRASGRFCVNVLSHRQQQLAIQFAKKGTDRYEGVDHVPGSTGAPRLSGAIAHIDCEIAAEHPAGDHTIVVGCVLDLELCDPQPAQMRSPLIFYQGGFAHLPRTQEAAT